MLELREICTSYGHIQALKAVTLTVQAGEIVSLVGANGAGKTTLLKSICGLLPPTQGGIWLDGRPIEGMSVEAIVRLGISHVPERRQIFGNLSVQDNLLLGAYSRLRQGHKKEAREEMARVYRLFPVLEERLDQLGGTLSGGEQQMLAIGRGLMARPRVLLLDEPSLGLAPLLIQEIFDTVQQLRDSGMTLLLVEQNARAALAISDRAYVLEAGKIVMSGDARSLMNDKEVQQAYLGRSKNQHRTKE